MSVFSDSVVSLFFAFSCRVQLESQPEAIDSMERQKFQLEVEIKALQKEGDQSSEGRLEKVKQLLANLQERLRPLKDRYAQEKSIREAIAHEKRKIEELRAKLERAERQGDTASVAELRYEILPDKLKRLQKLQEEQEAYEKKESPMISDTVGPEQIAEVVSRWTGIPVHKLSQSERQRLLNLKDALHTKIFGQEEAISAVCDAVVRSGAGLSKRHMPIGSFLFLGPTGK